MIDKLKNIIQIQFIKQFQQIELQVYNQIILVQVWSGKFTALTLRWHHSSIKARQSSCASFDRYSLKCQPFWTHSYLRIFWVRWCECFCENGKVHQMVLNDRQIKMPHISEAMNMSKERVRHILSQHFGMKSCPRVGCHVCSRQTINVFKWRFNAQLA